VKTLKLLLALILVFSTYVSYQPVVRAADQAVEDQSTPVDPRILKLESFFQKYNCPQPYHVPTYLEAADQYNLPYTLLAVISVKESGCGKQVFRKNNWWGFGNQSFPNIDQGIWTISQQLGEGKYYQGKTLIGKLKTYNSVNPKYPSHAIQLMDSIEN